MSSLLTLLKSPGGLVRHGLAAYYDFSDGSGQTLSDITGSGHDGQLGSVSGSDTNDPTWSGSSLVFDGVDDYVTLGGNLLSTDAERTYVAVVTPVSAPASTRVFLSAHVNYDGVAGGSKWISSGSFGGTQATITSDATFTTGSPTFLASVRGTSRFVQYVGTAKKSTAVSGTPSLTSVVTLGCFSTLSLFANVTLHSVLAYNRPLSDGEIRQLYVYLKGVMKRRGVSL